MKSRLIATALAVSLLAPGTADAQNGTTAHADPPRFDAMEYRFVGPIRGGRVTAVAGHAAQPTTFYFGSTG
ncbi:MAG TPA: hypothetical protein VK928_04315, partial [Longimicrobiales bacterium]|nr:hypothetical protein [Longimicrobiales bacterium]